jgi:D-lactate dehydrogenase
MAGCPTRSSRTTCARPLIFPNIVVIGHQAFFTREAMQAIVRTTLGNLDDFVAGRDTDNRLHPRSD